MLGLRTIACATGVALCACAEIPADPPDVRDPEAPQLTASAPSALVTAATPIATPIAASAPASRPTSLAPDVEIALDRAVNDAIARREIPGAVIAVVDGGRLIFERAYGARALVPAPSPMTSDAVFDLASLTKPVATAATIVRLAARGRLSVQTPLSTLVKACEGAPAGTATLESLLLHTSGLPAGSALGDAEAPRDAAIRRLCHLPTKSAPGEVFLYSDVGYILLGEAVSAAASMPFEEAFRQQISSPFDLGAAFSPEGFFARRAAPTEPENTADGDRGPPTGLPLWGRAHDPRARRLDGVAGHAGLFASARDLARFAIAFFDEGPGAPLSANERRVYFEAHDAAGQQRAYAGSLQGPWIGHTGFTGTGLWMDPTRKRALVLLTSRLHRADFTRDPASIDGLRRRVLAAVTRPRLSAPRVSTGADVAAQEEIPALTGRRIGLVANRASTTRQGVPTWEALRRQRDAKVVALFSPEHGLGAAKDESVGDGRDAHTGLPIYSLYGPRKKPTSQELQGIDTLVIDLQDAGVRFYTYETTLGLLLETAAEHHLRIVVLDRPNPLGDAVRGPVLDADRASFVGYHRVPIQHGLTMGELARLFNEERHIGADLTVIPMRGYLPTMQFEDTGLDWHPPSPNLRSPTSALLYPGVAIVELTNVSVGRGTERPFEQVGAPWIQADPLAQALTAASIQGLRVSPVAFTPKSGPFANEVCHGVAFTITDRAVFQPILLGIALAAHLARRHREAWRPQAMMPLLGSTSVFSAIVRGDSLPDILAVFETERAAFEQRSAPFRLYNTAP